MTMYQFQVDYGEGWTNVYPDGYGVHFEDCEDEDCEGCWDPDQDDFDPWFEDLEQEGVAVRARVLSGRQVIAETSFEDEEEDDLEDDLEEEE